MISVSTFSCDITPPMGSPLCGTPGIAPATTIDDPQFLLGFVLHGAGEPIVFAAADCVGFYSDAHDRLVSGLAAAAGTNAKRVILTSVHQHDAPMHDPEGQKLLDDHGLGYPLCNAQHYETLVEESSAAVRDSLATTRRVTHVGVGRAQVEKVAANRRLLGPDGKVAQMRNSVCYDPAVRALPQGLIDPDLTAVTLFDGDQPVVTINHYATHPMSLYGHGRLSADFCGLARARRRTDNPGCMQIYVTGCAGNIGAGKYNDGSDGIRDVLAERMYSAMVSASDKMQIAPVDTIGYKTLDLHLPTREDPGFTEEDAMHAIRNGADWNANASDTKDALRANVIIQKDIRHNALNMSWRRRSAKPINLPVLDVGVATLLLLPGEPFIEYQLAAREMRPDDNIIVIGYGNAGPGYLCTDIAYEQGGYESNLPAYTGRGAEAILMEALRAALS